MEKAAIKFANASKNPEVPDVEDVTPEELKPQLEKVHLIDVRRTEEFSGELGHIRGSKLILLDAIKERLSEIPKTGTIVFVCRSGARSARAAAFAKQNGITQVYNLKGGMMRWNQLGYTVEK